MFNFSKTWKKQTRETEKIYDSQIHSSFSKKQNCNTAMCVTSVIQRKTEKNWLIQYYERMIKITQKSKMHSNHFMETPRNVDYLNIMTQNKIQERMVSITENINMCLNISPWYRMKTQVNNKPNKKPVARHGKIRKQMMINCTNYQMLDIINIV